jgi:adenylate kinase family enzyme
MRIVVVGMSGAGKTTLAHRLRHCCRISNSTQSTGNRDGAI